MQKRKSVLRAVLQAKCPRCRTGDMFRFPLRNIFMFSKMNRKCPNCQMRFEVEPGFFIGAMYISYGMSVGLLLIVGIILYHMFSDPPLWIYLIFVSVILLGLLPVFFRYSRVLYLYWFGGVRYDQQLEKKRII